MAIALARIAEEAEQRTGELDLSNLGLASLPEALFELRHLRVLDLGVSDPWNPERRLNHIDAQRDRLGCLMSLKELLVVGSDLTSLVPIQNLHDLQNLDCSRTQVADLTPLAALDALQNLNCSGTEVADLTPLAGLDALQNLDCSSIQVADLTPLAGLDALQNLDCSSTQVADLTPLAGLDALQNLNCSGTQIADLSPLAGLDALQNLDCARTQIADLSPLAGLDALQNLNCSGTQVADLSPLAGLDALQNLNCWDTQVADLSPLAGLDALQNLDCSFTQVADLTPLAALDGLQKLDCSFTQVPDLTPLAGLDALQNLNCSGTQVADLTPLAGLDALQNLACSNTEVADLSPLAGLDALQNLACSNTEVADLSPLAGLDALQNLDCSGTQVADLSPLAGLDALQNLDCSQCRLQGLQPNIYNKPSLTELTLYESHVPGVPPTGILSENPFDSCLDRIRAHFADLDEGSELMTDVKLLLLGNGEAGKTQIARWLAGESFDPVWNSTHGIQIASALLSDNPPARLQIWDFGGQDIYHGTHALFLRSPAVLMPVWAKDTEERDHYEHGGLTFRNHPLDYWIDLVRHQGHGDSPVIVVQSKCDTQKQKALIFPARQESLEALPYCECLSVSTKENRGRAALDEALGNAIDWLRAPDRTGDARIGVGRLRVQRRLEALRDADMAVPSDQRRHRLMERSQFEEVCAEEGGVSSPTHLLTYLDANGTVFHRPGLFGDRIVLDQGWALEAIYAVFNRQRAFKELRWAGGRFTRSQLGSLVWQEHSEGEQKLFISMMRSCGICFLHRPFGHDEDDGELIAPDLLPERDSVAAHLPGQWDDDHPTEVAIFRYALLHDGLIRAIMAEVGEAAGPNALYWQGGLCGFEAITRSKLLIEQRMTGSWQGEIQVRTQRGQAPVLLDRLVKMVEKAQAHLGMQPLEMERTSPAVETKEQPKMDFRQEKSTMPEWYVSYAWGEDKTPEGKAREKVVDDLCAMALADGHQILRDKEVLGLGDSISRFMGRIGAGDRIFVILSDKYLRSPHCMFELNEIWRNSKQDREVFLQRVRIYALPDTKIWDPIDWTDWAIHWKEKYNELNERARQHGVEILGEPGYRRLRQMQNFYTQVSDILGTLADIVQPRSMDQLREYGFRDLPD
jgi:internalin A